MNSDNYFNFIKDLWKKSGLFGKILIFFLLLGIIPLILLIAIFVILIKEIHSKVKNPVLKWGLTASLFLLVYSSISPLLFVKNETSKPTQQNLSTENQQSAKTVQPTIQPTIVDPTTEEISVPPQREVQDVKPSPTKAPNPTTVFNDKKGNNSVAAAYSEELFELANNAASGYVESIFVESSPESTTGKSDEDYIDSVTSVFVQITVNRGLWNTTDDASKKDLMTAWLKHAKGKFSKSFPHIYIDNGLRRVAEAEFTLFGDPKITLK